MTIYRKRILKTSIAGVLTVGIAVQTTNIPIKVVNAAESKSLKNAKAKISHLTWSVKNNYLGIKNQGQWEVYIKEARVYISKMPSSESLQAKALNLDLDKIEALVQAVARVNQVEKSMEVNFHGVKNAKQWRAYLKLASEELVKVDISIFSDQIVNIVERLNICRNTVLKIEEEFLKEYNYVLDKFEIVKKTKDIDQANKVLKLAEALGTCEKSNKLEEDIKTLIEEINNSHYIISSIELINSKKLNIKFNKPVSDYKQIESDGERIVLTKYGESLNEADKIKSIITTFNNDEKNATVVFSENLKEGVKYTAHLVTIDGRESITSFTGVFREEIETPTIYLNENQDKIILNFNEKMNEEAIEKNNYKIINLSGNYLELPFTNAKWIDSVDKNKIEITLNKDINFRAGEEYKLIIDNTRVATYTGKKLSSEQKIIKFNTPSIEEARPILNSTYIDSSDTLVVKFNKEIQANPSTKDLISIKRIDGKKIDIISTNIIDGAKEVIIKVNPETFDDGQTFMISLQANTVTNRIYKNVGNNEVLNSNIVISDGEPITSVNAKFIVDDNNKEKANLLLTFDKPIKILEDIKDIISISSSGETYEAKENTKSQLYDNDISNKTLIIKDVNSKFQDNMGNLLTLESGKNYKIKVKSGKVATASISPVYNREDIMNITKGINVSKPEIDKVILESAEKVIIKFKDKININSLSPSDIKIKGFVKDINDRVSLEDITGSKQIKISSNEEVLTVTTVNDSVKFVTGKVADTNNNLITIDQNTIKYQNGLSNNKIIYGSLSDNIVDNSTPILFGGSVSNTKSLIVTFTEDIEFKDSTNTNKAAAQFSVEKVNIDENASGAIINENTILLNFMSDVFEIGRIYPYGKIIYVKNINYMVREKEGNKYPISSTNLIGISN